MKKPIIGITLDHETSQDYSKYPWYALRENYAEAVWKLGGVPLMLPHFVEATDHYLKLIDGLIVTGGAFDIDPSFYGEKIISDKVTMKDKRTQFEMEICRQAIEMKKPILGICGGEQLLNVIFNGSLIQHIPDAIANVLEHEQKNPKHETSHLVNVTRDTLLHQITGKSSFLVNSTHHQAVKSVGAGVKVNALAPDSVIEGIEVSDHPYCLGVQWHPEFLTTEQDNQIFYSFLTACR